MLEQESGNSTSASCIRDGADFEDGAVRDATALPRPQPHRIAMKQLLTPLLGCALALPMLAQHTTDAAHKGEPKDIVATAAAAGSFQTLLAAAKAAGLVETLQGKGPLTVFAPTDEAFAKLGKDTIAGLLKPENKTKLVSILTYHVVAGELPAAKVVKAKSLDTVQGSPLAVVVGDAGVKIGDATVTATDVHASNGVIHVIDSVLLPPANLVATAAKAGKFKTLLKAATAAGLAETLAEGGPFTVFAPTDEAFAELDQDTLASLLKPENKEKLAAILKLHVVAGRMPAADVVKMKNMKSLLGQEVAVHVEDGKVTVGGANVIATDVFAGNGVVHVIDRVLLPK
ncbi:MAG: fasciclin domain-containing protein [Planctomycetes bacterium]|nr:fasciclin domain-containing protein [Planctomycetota bacterium]